MVIRLSQAHLKLLEICPPKFQQVYIEQITSPLSFEQLEKLSWGSQFHLLMQQRELGLSIDSLLEEDEQMQKSIHALIKALPENLPNCWREAEHCRTLSFKNYLFTVIYDLLIASETKAEILDWKTYLQPENKAKLINDWQTKLYLYVLAETSEYPPENISMTYWFVKVNKAPKSVTITYSSKQHEKTRQDLNYLLAQLDSYLENYLHKNISFPHLPNCVDTCPYSSYLLEAMPSSQQDSTDWSLLIDEIEEIAI